MIMENLLQQGLVPLFPKACQDLKSRNTVTTAMTNPPLYKPLAICQMNHKKKHNIFFFHFLVF